LAAALHKTVGEPKKIKTMCLGIPGQVVSVTNANRALANVAVSGVKREVNLSCIVTKARPIELCIGDWVLVHVGFAMSRIDEAEAAATLKVLRELGEVQGELEAMAASGTA
jgi:hydrogenase expression/formation protein HypC